MRNVIVMGTTDFTVRCLAVLQERDDVAIRLVVAQPDRKRTRKGKTILSPVAHYANDNNLPLFQPESINTDESVARLSACEPDIMIVVAYGQILSQRVLDVPKIGAYNVHASLLPKYRGASPIEHALLHGETETGVTLQKMARKMDAGDIVLAASFPIDEEAGYGTLYETVIREGGNVLATFLTDIEGYHANATPQNPDNVTYCGKIKKEDGEIAWSASAVDIRNKVRAFEKWPVAYTHYEEKMLRVYKCATAEEEEDVAKYPNGSIIRLDQKQGMVVKTGEGLLALTTMQLEGKKIQCAKDFINGCRFEPNAILR